MSSSILPVLCLLLSVQLFVSAAPLTSSPCSASWRLPASPSSPISLSLQIDGWGNDGARVRISPSEIVDPSPQALTTAPPASTSCVPVSSSSPPLPVLPSQLPLSFTAGNLRFNITGAAAFSVTRVSDGRLLLQSTALSFTPYLWPSSFYQQTYASYYSVNFSYSQAAGALTYGLGEHHHGREELPYRDYEVDFTFSETAALKGDITIPWTLSSAGLAVLWNQPGFGSYSISGSRLVTWTAAATPQLDVFFSTTSASLPADESPFPQLLHSLIVATDSFPRPLPHYASGFWQCKLRYRSQEEVLTAAKGYVERGLPLSVIVIDYMSWLALGDFALNPLCFPEPDALVRQLRDWGIELMVSVWPHAGALSSNWPYMLKQGLLTHDKHGRFLNVTVPWLDWPPGPQPDASAVDFLSPAAQAYVQELLMRNYMAHGIKMFWLDADEPDCALPGQQWWGGRPDTEILSTYPLGVIRTVRAALDSSGLTDGLMLSRDTWVGGNSLGAAVWSGDIFSSFAELRRQVLVSQNVALSGIYHWTTDVGGFFNGTLGDATFEELIVRWFQFGVFCPIFRTHGVRDPSLPTDSCGTTGGHTEVWYYQHAELLFELLRLRETLRPYVEHHLAQAAATAVPLLQPMFFAFPGAESYAAETQYMFGPEWLVAPVLEQGATQRSVYLPAITDSNVRSWRDSRTALGDSSSAGRAEAAAMVWRHYFTGAEHSGGQMLTVQTELSDFPLFQLQLNSSFADPPLIA